MIHATYMGTDETRSSLFFSTQFDKAETALRKYFNGLPGADAAGVAGSTKKYLAFYADIARKKQEPYDRTQLEDWIRKLGALGVPRGHALIFLAGLRKMREAGQVGDAPWDPFAWLEAHPDEKRSFDEKISDAIKGLGKYLLMALGVAALAYAAPAALATYATSRRK